MHSIIQNIIARGRAFGIQNSEQFAIMATPVFHRPHSANIHKSKYFGGNTSNLRRRRKLNG